MLAAEGAHVVVHYHWNRAGAEAAGGALVVQADLTDEAETARLFAEAGELDACAAVAGIWPEDDIPVSELTLERWRATVDANLTATFLTARGFLENLGEREGSLVLVGSTAGLFGEAGTRRLRRREVGDPRWAPSLAEERGRAPQPAHSCERRRAGMDGLADDRERPRRAHGGEDHTHDGAREGRDD